MLPLETQNCFQCKVFGVVVLVNFIVLYKKTHDLHVSISLNTCLHTVSCLEPHPYLIHISFICFISGKDLMLISLKYFINDFCYCVKKI